MRYIVKITVIAVLLACGIVPALAFADIPQKDITQKASRDIQIAIEKLFEDKRPALEAFKKEFGAGEEENFSSASLREGIPYYSYDSKMNPIFRGYLFEILVQGEPIGLVKATDDGTGIWRIFEISTETTFWSDLSEAKKHLQNDKQTLLIYDISFHIYGIAASSNTGEGRFIPMRDHKPFFDFKPGKEVALNRLVEEVNIQYPNRGAEYDKDGFLQSGGGGGKTNRDLSLKNDNIPYIIISTAGLSILVILTVLYFHKKSPKV